MRVLCSVNYQVPIVVLINNERTPVVFSNSTHIMFILVPGVGRAQSIIVYCGADTKSSVPQPWISYAPPTVTNIVGCGGSTNDGTLGIIDCNRNGGDTITISGHNFGQYLCTSCHVLLLSCVLSAVYVCGVGCAVCCVLSQGAMICHDSV